MAPVRWCLRSLHLDVGLHHVHANATARDGGHHGRGGEPGAEYEPLQLCVAHAGEFGLGGQSVGQHLGANPVHRQAAAIIGNLDDDVAAFVIRVQCDVAGSPACRPRAVRQDLPDRGRHCCAPCASADP